MSNYKKGEVMIDNKNEIIIFENQDIKLLSSGKSVSSKIYSADALTAVLTLMKNQACGIFNVANEKATASVKKMAKVAITALNNKKINKTHTMVVLFIGAASDVKSEPKAEFSISSKVIVSVPSL